MKHEKLHAGKEGFFIPSDVGIELQYSHHRNDYEVNFPELLLV
jgi:hypothetical protein